HHAFRAEDWQKAAEYLRQAANKAWDRSEIRETVKVCEHALEALTHLPQGREKLEQGIDMRLQLCSLFDALAEPNRSLDYAREAQALAEKLDDLLWRGRVLARLCYSYVLLGEPAAAAEPGEAALVIGSDLNDVQLVRWASYWLALVYMQRGSYQKSIEYLSP